MSAINQKEYLKKYLSSDDKEEKKKKRKKKARPAIERVKIIDDDIDLSQVTTFEEAADLLNTNEDAPQIVGVIDERPLHLRIDDYRKSELWKPLGDSGNNSTSSIEQKEITDLKKEIQYKTFRNVDNPSSTHKVKVDSYRRENNIREQIRNDCPVQKNDDSSYGNRSPQSKSNVSAINNESSPSSSSKSAAVNDDNSPPRRKSRWSDGRNDTSPSRRVGDDFDNSPPRMNRNHNKSPQRTSRISVNNDSSPPRRSSKSTIVNDDSSPSRKQKRTVNDDNSPPRRKSRRSDDVNDASPPRRVRCDFDNIPARRNRNPDKSPQRTSKISAINDDSSPRRNSKSTIGNDDNSPPRKQKRIIEDDNSPPRRKSRRSDDRNDTSLPRKVRNNSPSHMNRNSDNVSRTSTRFSDYDESLPRKLKTDEAKTDDKPRKLLPGNKKGKYLIPAKRGIEKMTKTLDGKNAGLQNARELIKETEEFRKREDDLFKNLSAEMSGVNATTIIRDKKTGKIRDLQKEAEEQKEKQKKEEENKEKYARWGRGLKQVEDYEDKLAQDLHEMNKPLARYADDEDLEKFLKEKDREGDPMLDYIRKKRKKKVIKSGKPLKPEYEGEFMPNRFAIRPGHRWDGVDRSNGYEKKWFQIQNEKRAQQEEIYKWSTEDM